MLGQYFFIFRLTNPPLKILEVIWGTSRSLEEKFHNLCPVHIFLIDKLGRFSFHTKIAHDPRVCHYLKTRSFWQEEKIS